MAAEDLARALADLKEGEALEISQDRLKRGDNAMDILADARRGMALVGERFASGEYFIPDLVYSGEILKQITEMVKPRLTGQTGVKRLGKVVLGTVAGDIHDIGLNIVDFMLDTSGFEVFNLGVDVPAAKFAEKIKETGAGIVGLSGFLTLAFDAMKETVATIESAGLRDKVRIMIGGGQIDEQVKAYTGADAYGKDAMEAVTLARKWTTAGK
jgi:5-methyltetrahydrofolate--homocysteine methyltransferase